MKDLQNYTSALQDVGLDSTPVRNENGQYQWSNGQLEILNQDIYSGIRKNQLRIRQIEKSIRSSSGEILAFEDPVEALEKEGHELLSVDQDAIDDQRVQADQYKSLLYQLDRDMLIRGYIPPDESNSDDKSPEVKKIKPKGITFREIIGFLSVWLIGEIFMTYVQWNTLRDGKGIEDMIIRSISLGVVLFLIHLVGRHFKRDRRPLQLVFLVFSFLMLFTMLLAPLLLQEAYPSDQLAISTGSEWSLDESAANSDPTTTDVYPFWVSFYRNNDMLPGILVFLFFVIMQTFGRTDQKLKLQKPEENTPAGESFLPADGKMQIEERRKYYKQQIARAEERLNKLAAKQNEAVAPNTKRLHEILDELNIKRSEMIDLQQKKSELEVQNDLLLRKLELQLNRYRTEFINVLNNDPVKSMVTRPDWPNRQDILMYFNLSLL